MNIEESIEILKKEPDYSLNYYNRENAIDVLLTAYEKEKEANKKLDKEAQGYLEELAGDGSMNIRRIQELEAELEKEKEKVDSRESVILDKEKEITKLNNEIYELKKRIHAINLLSFEEE